MTRSWVSAVDQERELVSRLSVQRMEEIAGASQALVDRLLEMAKSNALHLTTWHRVAQRWRTRDQRRAKPEVHR